MTKPECRHQERRLQSAGERFAQPLTVQSLRGLSRDGDTVLGNGGLETA